MSIYEAIGVCWVVLTSSIATVMILLAAYRTIAEVIAPRNSQTTSLNIPLTEDQEKALEAWMQDEREGK